MDAETLIELDTIQNLVKTAALADNARHSVTWCLGNLPCLYRDLVSTYDNRYGSEIRRNVQAVLLKLAEKSPDSPDSAPSLPVSASPRSTPCSSSSRALVRRRAWTRRRASSRG